MDHNEINELKKMAAEKTGVPAEMITGETVKEIAESAFNIAAYAKEAYDKAPTRDKFAAWLNGTTPAEMITDPAAINNNSYPIVPDGGTPQNIEYERDPRDAFREWFGNVSAFDPRKNRGNW